MDEALDFETIAAHSGLGAHPDDAVSVSPGINPSTTFTYDSVRDVHAALKTEAGGFAYSRNANPTVVALERAFARMEKAEDVVAFGSGMAAIHGALLGIGLKSGDTILASKDLYGVTRALLIEMETLGIRTVFVDINHLEAVEGALLEHRPKLLYFESISNPLLRVPDAEPLISLGHGAGALVAIDNTFATSYIFRPVELGADVVLYSATKYVAGHGDVVAGLVAGDASLMGDTRKVRTVTGGILGPFEAWLTLRGMRTLAVRMDRHCANALQLATWLEQQKWAEKVYHPRLAPGAERGVAYKQFGDKHGGMLAVDLAANEEQVLDFIDALQLIVPGTSLGDVESLVLYPQLSSHRTLSESELAEAGIGKGLIRLSVGLESVADLIADLQHAAELVLQAGRKAHPQPV